MILKNAVKIKAKRPGLKLGADEISDKEWTLLNSFTVTLPKKLFYVKVPLVDWGEECPSCLIGVMDDEWGEEDLECDNCKWRTPWVYANLRWMFIKQRKSSK